MEMKHLWTYHCIFFTELLVHFMHLRIFVEYEMDYLDMVDAVRTIPVRTP